MIVFFLAALAAATRAFGDYREPNYALLLALALGFLWRSAPPIPHWRPWINWLWRWGTWALAAGLILAADPLLRIVLVTVAVWGFDRFGPAERRGQARPLVLLGGLYALWWGVLFQLPIGYRWLLEWTFPYSEIITEPLSTTLILGPSASAIDLLLLGICGVIAFTLASKPRRWLYAGVSLVVLEAGRILYIWLAPTVQGAIGSFMPVSSTPHLDMPGLYFLFVAGLLALLYRTTSPLPCENRWRIPLTPAVGAGAVAVVLAFVVAGAASYTSRPVRVLFLNMNTLDQGVPTHGRYGDRSGGMFGFLPLFLESCGHQIFRGEATAALLDSVDVIFIANLLKKLPPDQRQNVWDFVDGGGGLLIVGDHTGTDAIRDPTNDLLSPCGLEINFDTAVPLRRSWASARSFLFHPLGRSGGIMDAELWLGASVDPGPSGEPFVIGRGAFSDPGDMNNKARSYLGNLAYDAGEPLGDVVLAAAAHWGDGKAILHGDTSPYQNGTIIRSHSLINRSIRWLARDGWGDFIDQWRAEILAVLLGAVGTVFLIASLTNPGLIWVALLLPAISISFWTHVPGAPHYQWEKDQYKSALLDEGHTPNFDGMAWETSSIGGLQYNLLRSGFSPRFASSPLELQHLDADLYIICAPTAPFQSDEIDQLEEYVEGGGWLLVGAGWDSYPAVRDLLERFGLSMRNIPLGKAEGDGLGGTVKMSDAYPVVGDGDNIEILIQAFGYSIGKVVRRGTGGMIAIGDSEFLLNGNLEGQNEFVVMENVIFLRELFAATVGSMR